MDHVCGSSMRPEIMPAKGRTTTGMACPQGGNLCKSMCVTFVVTYMTRLLALLMPESSPEPPGKTFPMISFAPNAAPARIPSLPKAEATPAKHKTTFRKTKRISGLVVKLPCATSNLITCPETPASHFSNMKKKASPRPELLRLPFAY